MFGRKAAKIRQQDTAIENLKAQLATSERNTRDSVSFIRQIRTLLNMSEDGDVMKELRGVLTDLKVIQIQLNTAHERLAKVKKPAKKAVKRKN